MKEDSPQTGGHKPRSPEDHDVTGTGTPRSADDGLPQPGAASDTEADPAVITGKTATAHPASPDDMTINRSGSGSGGPVEPDESVEGSAGQSMEELLTGEDETNRRTR